MERKHELCLNYWLMIHKFYCKQCRQVVIQVKQCGHIWYVTVLLLIWQFIKTTGNPSFVFSSIGLQLFWRLDFANTNSPHETVVMARFWHDQSWNEQDYSLIIVWWVCWVNMESFKVWQINWVISAKEYIFALSNFDKLVIITRKFIILIETTTLL